MAARVGFTTSYGFELVATIVTRFVLGLWLCCGVHVITPLALIVIPAGGAIKA